MTRRARGGDCFEAAITVAQEHRSFTTTRVVHGLPLGTGPLNRGKRYWHAWVEVGGTVVDYSNGHEIVMAREEYYRLGQLDETRVYRYTLDEALAHVLDGDRTWGPWLPNWKELAEA